MNIEIISTGDEVITGEITDTNVSYLCSLLLDLGFQAKYRHTVGDKLSDIVSLLSERSHFADLIFVNGGLGPTTDDNSTQAAAIAANVPQVLNESWKQRLLLWHKERNRVMPENNLKQAMLPKGATLIDNKNGTACGFSIQINKALCIFTPGVPHEFKAMLNDSIIPNLKNTLFKKELKKITVKKFFLFGISESKLDQSLSYVEQNDDLTLGYRAYYPLLELKVIYNQNVMTKVDQLFDKIRQQNKDYIICEDNYNDIEVIQNFLVNTKFDIYDNYTNGKLLEKFCTTNNLKSYTYLKDNTDISTFNTTGSNNYIQLFALPKEDNYLIKIIVKNGELPINLSLSYKLSFTLKNKGPEVLTLLTLNALRKELENNKSYLIPDGSQVQKI